MLNERNFKRYTGYNTICAFDLRSATVGRYIGYLDIYSSVHHMGTNIICGVYICFEI